MSRSPRGQFISSSPALGHYRRLSPCPTFLYVSSGDHNSGPHVHMASILSTEPSPQPYGNLEFWFSPQPHPHGLRARGQNKRRQGDSQLSTCSAPSLCFPGQELVNSLLLFFCHHDVLPPKAMGPSGIGLIKPSETVS